MEVTEASGGFEALAILEKQRFDDDLERHYDAGSFGVALLEAIRKLDLTTQVIYATGNPSLHGACARSSWARCAI